MDFFKILYILLPVLTEFIGRTANYGFRQTTDFNCLTVKIKIVSLYYIKCKFKFNNLNYDPLTDNNSY